MSEGLFDKYFKDIRDYEQIDYEEEVKLVNRAQNGDLSAYHKLVTSNLRFVITQAKKFTNQGLDLIDLVSAGNIGLMKAIERFDPSQGYKLITYAVWWIKQSMHDALANESRVVRLPLNKIGIASNIIKDLRKQEIGTSEVEALNKVRQKYDLTEYEAIEILQLYSQTNTELRDQILEINVELIGENFLKKILDSETEKVLTQKLDVLNERERLIATKYFALFGKSWTLEMIGEELNLTRERVRQIKVNILKKLESEVAISDFTSKEDLNYPSSDTNRKRSSIKLNVIKHFLDYKSDEFEVVAQKEIGLEESADNIDADIEDELSEDLLFELYEEL
ncbi:sigma-70 family RNA polymerase sigma factor [Fodinibius sp. AD559]|uniref:sigma-70 family RNA polymerase sigma factor n=1 Tax=Fodinibius sp. AD559 TaxID=3424179 RepID=UPI004046A348